MSCNRIVHQSSSIAANLGIPKNALEAAFAGGRKMGQIEICPVCRNCILRGDGGCTKCENRLVAAATEKPGDYAACYARGTYYKPVMEKLAPVMVDQSDLAVKAMAARYLTDSEKLFDLAHEKDVGVLTAVAGNVHTNKPTLSVLVNHEDYFVCRAATFNPSTSTESLVAARKKAKIAWDKVMETISQDVSRRAMRRGRKEGIVSRLAGLVTLGMYGLAAMRPYQRYADLRDVVSKRQATGNDGQSASPQQASSRPTKEEERQNRLFFDGLEIAEGYLKDLPDYYGAGIEAGTIDNIREFGPQNNDERRLTGLVIDEMEEAERGMPGWFRCSLDDFDAIRKKYNLPTWLEKPVEPVAQPSFVQEG